MAPLKIKPRKTKRQPGKPLGEVVAWCTGSLQAPEVKRGKPHCLVCGQAFHWYEMVDQITHVPEH
jgi:hypothetical protein